MKRKILSLLCSLVFLIFYRGQSQSFEKTFKVNFPHGQADVVCYINFPRLIIGGEIEIDIAGYYNWQENMGGMTKKIGLLSIPEGYFSQSSIVDKSYGLLSYQCEIGNFDPQHYRIPIYHKASSGNELYIRVKGLVQDESTAYAILNNIKVSDPVVGGKFQGSRKHNINVDYFGINIDDPQYTLDVNGTIHAKEVKVDMNGWSDFVFKKDYNLRSLEEVAQHIKEKGTLPDIPSEKEVLEKGISLGEMNKRLLQKIEELTLYQIQMNKGLKQLKEENKELREQIKN